MGRALHARFQVLPSLAQVQVRDEFGAEILHLMIRLRARKRAVERRPHRQLAEQAAEMAIHLVLAPRRVVDDLLAGMRAVRQPFRIDPERLARGPDQHPVGRVRPFPVDAFLADHRELIRRIAVRPQADVFGHGERVERREQRGERRVVELRERALARGGPQPARLLRGRLMGHVREIGGQGGRVVCGRHRAGCLLRAHAGQGERQRGGGERCNGRVPPGGSNHRWCLRKRRMFNCAHPHCASRFPRRAARGAGSCRHWSAAARRGTRRTSASCNR